MSVLSVRVKALRPTQLAVGKLLVKHKRKGLQAEERKPQELVNFILANPIRVISGPQDRHYIIDHHHLGCALLKEGFETAPVIVVDDLSKMNIEEFWKAMDAHHWVHAFDGKGRARDIADIPSKLADMEDDPYRSLAGFVRHAGGFAKTETPYMEFAWADYFRPLINLKKLEADFEKEIQHAKDLALAPAAAHLPGFIVKA